MRKSDKHQQSVRVIERYPDGRVTLRADDGTPYYAIVDVTLSRAQVAELVADLTVRTDG